MKPDISFMCNINETDAASIKGLSRMVNVFQNLFLIFLKFVETVVLLRTGATEVISSGDTRSRGRYPDIDRNKKEVETLSAEGDVVQCFSRNIVVGHCDASSVTGG